MARRASKRVLIAPRGGKRYVRRDPEGRIKESDDQGRSHAQDRRRKARVPRSRARAIGEIGRPQGERLQRGGIQTRDRSTGG